MLVYKSSLLFQVTTEPVDKVYATSHSGGWSEGFWTNYQPTGAVGATIQNWADARALMLPSQMTIVGYRISVYDLTNNKLTPGGTSAGKLIKPGLASWSASNPQAALQLGWPAIAGPNASRIVLRGLPDEVVVNGEFNGSALFRQGLSALAVRIGISQFGWVGRDLSQPSAVVNKIAGNVVTLSQPLAGLGAGDFLRFRKCYNDAGSPVKGSYLVTAAAGSDYTIQAYLGGNLTTPSGTARKDVVAFIQGGVPIISRTVVRKIGRPFESYRGRRSKSR